MHCWMSLLLLLSFTWLTAIIYCIPTQCQMMCIILHLYFADNLHGYRSCVIWPLLTSPDISYFILCSSRTKLRSSHQRPQTLITQAVSSTQNTLYRSSPPCFPSYSSGLSVNEVSQRSSQTPTLGYISLMACSHSMPSFHFQSILLPENVFKVLLPTRLDQSSDCVGFLLIFSKIWMGTNITNTIICCLIEWMNGKLGLRKIEQFKWLLCSNTTGWSWGEKHLFFLFFFFEKHLLISIP